MAAAAAEEDTELRDLLVQTLESSGVLNKIKVGEEEPPAGGERRPALAAPRGPAERGRTEAASPLAPACSRCSRLERSLGVAAWRWRLLSPWCSPAARGGAGARARGLTVARRCPAAAGIGDPPGGQSAGGPGPAVFALGCRAAAGAPWLLPDCPGAMGSGVVRDGAGQVNPYFATESPY